MTALTPNITSPSVYDTYKSRTENLIKWSFAPATTTNKVVNAIAPAFKVLALFFLGCITFLPLIGLVAYDIHHAPKQPLPAVKNLQQDQAPAANATPQEPPVEAPLAVEDNTPAPLSLVPKKIEKPKSIVTTDFDPKKRDLLLRIQAAIAGDYIPPVEKPPLLAPKAPLLTSRVMIAALGVLAISYVFAYCEESVLNPIADTVSFFTNSDNYYRKLS